MNMSETSIPKLVHLTKDADLTLLDTTAGNKLVLLNSKLTFRIVCKFTDYSSFQKLHHLGSYDNWSKIRLGRYFRKNLVQTYESTVKVSCAKWITPFSRSLLIIY